MKKSKEHHRVKMEHHKAKMEHHKKEMKKETGAGMDKSKKEYGSMDKKPLSKMPKRGRGKDVL